MAEKGSSTTGYARALMELGAADPRVVVMDADVGDSVKVDAFAARYPGRFVQSGIAEQNMVGMAAGLSLTGKVVFVNTFAAFATVKTYDQIRMAVAYAKADVKIVGGAAGLALGEAGPSHHALEDLAIMRALPNMEVLCPCDEEEAYQMTKALAARPGPAYLRLFRQDVAPLNPPGYEWRSGQPVVLRPGRDLTIFATGLMVTHAMQAAEKLAQEGMEARVVNIHTIKPLNVDEVIQQAEETKTIMTVEEHSIIGGLGSAVAEVFGEHCPVPIKRVGIPDKFCESADTCKQFVRYGIDVDSIVASARRFKAKVLE